MSRGARRLRIPLPYQDIGAWPSPDISLLNRDEQNDFLSRRHAVEMYASGSACPAILTATGIGKSELYRMVARCLVVRYCGQIYGFFALLRGIRIGVYTRRAAVIHQPGSGSGGCSGALTQLFERFPEVEDLVIDKFRNEEKGLMPESRVPVISIHESFKNALLKLGFTDYDWPFNTSNCGYKSLHAYLRDLRNGDPQGTAIARSGTEAEQRGAVGTGTPSILPSLRPYGAMQLDFHKVDSASTFVLKNDFGEEFEVPLSRWYFGFMVEETKGAAVGFCVVLDLNPSGDDTLEIVSNALSSRGGDFDNIYATGHGQVLVNQLIPELEYQGFSVLKVDRAWANAAHEVVNNIMDVVGCAVNFGPVRSWWVRQLIEQVFGELTRRGLQRLPSTQGKGPGDTRINEPNAQAVRFRIGVQDLVDIFLKVVREHNLKGSEGSQWSSRITHLRAALDNPMSGFFPQPLPKPAQAQRRLMMHVEEVTVLGNLDKNIRPYFNLDRHKHTNEKLANSFSLIGKKLIVYVDRRLARIVYATVKETGEQLGLMRISGPWAESDCTWRFRKLMNRSGMSKRFHACMEDPLEQVKQEKMAQLKKLKKKDRTKSSRTALEVAKIEAQQVRAAKFKGSGISPTSMPDSPVRKTPAPPSRDPFGINTIPQID